VDAIFILALMLLYAGTQWLLAAVSRLGAQE
jgi:hypothetical protein